MVKGDRIAKVPVRAVTACFSNQFVEVSPLSLYQILRSKKELQLSETN